MQESITFLYRDLGDAWLYETAPVDAAGVLQSARDAEAARFTAGGGQGVVLRFGTFYAPYAPSTLATVRLARWRLFPAACVLARSQRVANTMFKAVAPWAPSHPDVRLGWQAVARELGAAPRA